MSKNKSGLTIRQRRLIKGLMDGLTAAEAMRRAGYAESTVQKQSTRTVGVSSVSETLTEALDRAGVTDEKLARTLYEGLHATKLIRVRGPVCRPLNRNEIFEIMDRAGYTQEKLIKVFYEIHEALSATNNGKQGKG